ncbi:MAG: carbonic anhydrase [Cyclobacteriaceae bacterium]|nr:MAG: carbonic anhydrase [Cyclobacteriaceae bacterium]
MTTRERILLESKAWVQEKLALDKGYFKRLSAMHNPELLWIGSSDSLVPVREITNTEPGEILVYRNVGNLVKENDLSLMALLQDALEVSRIKYIIVCGYSHCSSLREVIQGTEKPLLREWLVDLRATYELHHQELDPLPYEQKEQRLAELNIEQQVKNLSKLDLIQKAWKHGTYPKLYGWYFDLNTGLFNEITHIDPAEPFNLPSN